MLSLFLFFSIMTAEIFLVHFCPYCQNNKSTSNTLRKHLESIHTLKCKFKNERRKSTKEITFVTNHTNKSRTCLGCCYCKMYFDDVAESQKHIENGHVIMTTVVNVNATSTPDVNNTKVREE
ncbi:hypothetical protein F4703DRAFT_1247159 [Phycomyces blakesleeanus]